MSRNHYQDQAYQLYETAQQNDKIEIIYKDLQTFRQGVGGEVSFAQMMTYTRDQEQEKKQLMIDITEEFEIETQQFFRTFQDYDYIFRSVEYFEALYEEHRVEIITAIAVDEKQLRDIIQKVSETRKHRIDTYVHRVDTSVIGGVCVQAKNYIIDTTLRTQLERFKVEMI